MIIKLKDIEYNFPDYNLNYLDIKDLENRISVKDYNDILDSLLNDLDCTREFSCGRPMMTTYPMYARNINAYMYILDQAGALVDYTDYDKYIEKLIQRHKSNIEFENANPYIEPVIKKKQIKRKTIKYKTKDLITGEDSYLIEDIKTKKHIVRKNTDIIKSGIHFDFNSKDESY